MIDKEIINCKEVKNKFKMKKIKEDQIIRKIAVV